ncbi:glycosyltransferase family 2 protein [Dokdonella ginsengisoli]|uniref:Glycosyltransferase family 2 protein n=1 Tax=Dokdonella ginsengisoli TaxID=363846 RepID=A0ABV9QZ45_9GAMM
MNAAAPLISVVSPVYCCEGCLRELCGRLTATLSSITDRFEIILVDDASPDRAWDTMRELCATDPRIKAVGLSRNFGQHYAIAAGLEQTRGEWVVVMDCDLQDRPEEIAALYSKALEGYDVVFGEREVRRDGWFKRTSSRLFIGVLNYLSGADYDYRTANFGVFHRRVVDAVRSMGDSSRFFPVMVRWTGFRRTSMPIRHDARSEGRSAYTWRRLVRLGLDIILSNSDKPLRLVAVAGIVISIVALIITAYSLLRYLHGDIDVAGYTSLIASMWLLAGVMLFCMGVIGLYVGRVFESVKARPVFIVRERINL